MTKRGESQFLQFPHCAIAISFPILIMQGVMKEMSSNAQDVNKVPSIIVIYVRELLQVHSVKNTEISNLESQNLPL